MNVILKKWIKNRTELVCSRIELDCLESRDWESTSIKAIIKTNKVDRNIIGDNCQWIIEPNIRLDIIMVKLSNIKPRRVPVICWIDNASEARRTQIEPELFSGKSKKEISWRSKYENALIRIRSVNLDPDIAKQPN